MPAFAQQAVGEVFASDATVRGSVQLTSGGAKVMSGANVTAGDAAARLALARGGELRVCPGTSIAVTASSNGRELMFGMGTGAIEADYKLASSADSVMTPDFRILLAGPGTFHFALRSRPNGDTCVQARASNSSAIVVTEVMGDATYQVKPNEQVLFRKGRLADAEVDPAEDCGCPAPAPTLRAEAPPAPAAPASAPVLMAATPASPTPPAEAAAPAPDPTAAHVEVDSPFIFRAEDSPLRQPLLRASLASLPALPAVEPLPPPLETVTGEPAKPPKKKGAFARMKAFLASIFK
ncbi:MAG: hypothetical protein HYX28_08835 [Candidatus Koribacter versatilis]|uniref:FecR protein domain-containing protein n=1 Tax=Candidatus Korobacter versatilis TaxID=658062 RepID=A0A932A8Z4_9BACT|nr:hypothetical protein [Candidatus Koribacter versatilis]